MQCEVKKLPNTVGVVNDGSYNVKQSDRNSSKADIFHKLAIYEQHV